MKHNFDELLEIVYRYYPRAIESSDSASNGDESDEHQRLVDARRHAATDARWKNMLRRIEHHFPGMIANHSLHLPTGQFNACYVFTLSVPNAPDHQTLWFGVSFIAPYYVVWRSRLVDVVKEVSGYGVPFLRIHFSIWGQTLNPQFESWVKEENLTSTMVKETDISFDLTKDEQSYADWIIREIESTFGCEPMPPEIGTQVIADVTTNGRELGEARLYDCLFTDQHAWVKPSGSDNKAGMGLDAERLPTSLRHVLTVLAAFYHIALQWLGAERTTGSCVTQTDIVLRKDELLKSIEQLHTKDASKVPSEAIAALREFETLIAAWNGEGDPPEALLAWATSVLDRVANDILADPEIQELLHQQEMLDPHA